MPKPNNRIIELLIHFVVWVYLLSTPFIFTHHNDTLHWQQYVQSMFVPMMLCLVFYVNYLVFVPRFFMQHRNRAFGVSNVLLIAACTTCIVIFMHYVAPLLRESLAQSGVFDGMPPKPHHGPHGEPHPPKPMKGFPFGTPKHPVDGARIVMMTLRDAFGLICAAAVAMGIRLSASWRKDEEKRKEMQLQLADAALKNLKTQTSPHFLLNTLNNIYSLTAFDTEKAQYAISELSKMLRYQLYESDTEKVLLRKEADFLSHYIALMRLRISEEVKITTHIDIAADDSIVIAPHVLISLVENAFKHGISAAEPSFIDIKLEADLERIVFECTNSNFPQSADSDKTQGGIGLQQVEQRLNLVYPGYHTWEHGPSADGKTYSSKIIIRNDAAPLQS
ncbi:MAG: sensor histidine kinase [Bacteroidales bacterium]|nr:sensor histidine kinase [Bacteroidales bacterium]